MDRVDFYFKQLLTEAELDAAFDDVENALWQYAIDTGVIGMTRNGVVLEDSPKSVNVRVTADAVGYDKSGRRIYWGGQQLVDATVDENSVSMIPSAGNERIVMLVARFDRNLFDLRVDGNSASVYYERDEYFELAIVGGPEVTAPASFSNPAHLAGYPTTDLVLADILLDENVGTNGVAQADINTDRRDDFEIYSASMIPVTSSGWTEVVPATDDVQAALDAVDAWLAAAAGTDVAVTDGSWVNISGANVQLALDSVDAALTAQNEADEIATTPGGWTEISGSDVQAALDSIDVLILSRDGSGRIDEDLIPTGGGETLGDATYHWDSVYADSVYIDTLLAAVTGDEDIGTTGTRFGTVYATDLNASDQVLADYVEPVSGAANKEVGTTGNRWTKMWAVDYEATDQMLADYMEPASGAANKEVGTSGNPWTQVRSTGFTSYSSTVSGALALSAAKTVARRTRFNVLVADTGWSTANESAKSGGGRVLRDFVDITETGTSANNIMLRLLETPPHGSTITTVSLGYRIDVNSGSLTDNPTAQLYYRDNSGELQTIGSAVAFSTTGSWQDDAVVITSLTEVVSHATRQYYLEITSGFDSGGSGSIDTTIYDVQLDYTLTDLGQAAAAGTN